MTAKEYLRQIKNLEIKIAQRRSERDQLIADAMGNVEFPAGAISRGNPLRPVTRSETNSQTRPTSSMRLIG